MKNQYFGDIYDYIKYSLLRHLSNLGHVSTAICWMLTRDDERRDGNRIHYLSQPEIWRKFDPAVFQFLHSQIVKRNHRNVDALENSDVLKDFQCYSEILTDDQTTRSAYFERFLKSASGTDLVFFDPDNGIEVKSVKYGGKGSSKYLFWAELKLAYAAGHSVLIYQHFPPKPRQELVEAAVSNISDLCNPHKTYSFQTKRVAFFLVAQSRDEPALGHAAMRFAEEWADVVEVNVHPTLR